MKPTVTALVLIACTWGASAAWCYGSSFWISKQNKLFTEERVVELKRTASDIGAEHQNESDFVTVEQVRTEVRQTFLSGMVAIIIFSLRSHFKNRHKRRERKPITRALVWSAIVSFFNSMPYAIADAVVDLPAFLLNNLGVMFVLGYCITVDFLFLGVIVNWFTAAEMMHSVGLLRGDANGIITAVIGAYFFVSGRAEHKSKTDGEKPKRGEKPKHKGGEELSPAIA